MNIDSSSIPVKVNSADVPFVSSPLKRRRGDFRRKPLSRSSQFEKEPIARSIVMNPRQEFIEIFTSSNAIPLLGRIAWETLNAKVKVFDRFISQELLTYVLAISWYARLCRVAGSAGTKSGILGSYELNKATEGIYLPTFLVKYIETLGIVTMANGQKVVPYANNYRELIPLGSPWYYDPREALEIAGRPIPDNEWCIDNQWIAVYISRFRAKLDRATVSVSTVSYGSEGSDELLAGREPVNDQEGCFRSISPQRSLSSTAGLGIVYDLRDYSSVEHWPFGDSTPLPPLFEGEIADPTKLLSSMFDNALSHA